MTEKRLRYILIVIFVVVLTLASRHFVSDDSLIYARYARNAVAGRGLVFNINEHVNAMTSPVYCYLLLLVGLIFGNVILASKIIFVLSLIAACLLAENLCRFAGVFVAAFGYFYIVQGLETSVFLMMLALACLLYHEERWNWLPTVYVLLALTRFEGALLGLLLFSAQLYRRKMPSPRSFIPAAAVALGYGALNLYWFGSLLPSSAGAKFGQGMSGYWGPWPTAFLHPHNQMVKLATSRRAACPARSC